MTTDEADSTASPLPFDTGKAHQARMYGYLLGGKGNYAADRAAAAARRAASANAARPAPGSSRLPREPARD